MLETLKNAFKIKDVRRRIYYVVLMLVIVRIGSQLPIPGVDRDFFKQLFANQSNDAFNFFNAFTGGSFETMSIFALSITPYITSSIIIQLLTIAIPKLEEMQRDGEEGRKKMTAITRYVTIALALFQSVTMAIGFGNRGWLTNMNFTSVVVAVATLTAGSAMLMWIGEQITEKGVGNGISIVLMINIVSRIPSDLVTLFDKFVKGKTIARGGLSVIIIAAIIILVVVMVLILNGAERRIPVQYSKKMVGRKMMGGQSSNIPLKVNTAGVIPIIFASSLMSFPVIIASFLNKGNGTGIGSKILKGLSSSNWFNPDEPVYSIGLILYIVLVIFFAYFYTSITFNPMEVADNMKKQGGFIPGVRPGRATAAYIKNALNKITLPSAVFLALIAIVPSIIFSFTGNHLIQAFGGTSILIMVGVVLDTVDKLEGQIKMYDYDGFFK